jgi:alpha-mannosidase
MTNTQLGTVLSKNVKPEHPDDQVFTVLDINFVAQDIPEFGYRTWWLKPGVPKSEKSPAIRLGEGGMENDFLKVVFHDDGTFDLHHKASGHVFSNLHYLADREDIGDAYDYHGFKQPEEEDSRHCSNVWQVHEILDQRITFKRTWNWSLPTCLEGEHRCSNRKEMPVTVQASLHAGVPRLDMTVEVENTCKDHCLRLVLNTGLKADVSAVGGNFDVVLRKIRPENGEWYDQPLQEFVDISDGNHGLCLATKGLPAYEAVHGPNGTRLYLTLLRAVGHLGPAAGADHPTPLAQTPGYHRFEYALIPHLSSWEKCDLLNMVEDYQSPLLVEADLLHSGRWPSTGSLFKIHTSEEQKVCFTCLKQAEDGNGFILRLWNPLKVTQSIHLTSGVSLSEAFRMDLKEETLESLDAKSVDVLLPVKSLTSLRLIPVK